MEGGLMLTTKKVTVAKYQAAVQLELNKYLDLTTTSFFGFFWRHYVGQTHGPCEHSIRVGFAVW
jgi:hypothetical protein